MDVFLASPKCDVQCPHDEGHFMRFLLVRSRLTVRAWSQLLFRGFFTSARAEGGMLPYGTRSLKVDLVDNIHPISPPSTSGSFLFTDFFFDDKKTSKWSVLIHPRSERYTSSGTDGMFNSYSVGPQSPSPQGERRHQPRPPVRRRIGVRCCSHLRLVSRVP
jgi:hypothetical protein